MFSRSQKNTHHASLDYEEDWHEPKRPPRDWKKVFLVLGLGALSWVATYVGMLELIQANMGELDFTTKIVVGFSVAMLMTMIIWLLDQMFAPHPFGVKVAYVAGYLFLTLISVGFGFGFYWKVLESRSEASRSAESAVAQVQAALVAGAARLDQLQGTLDQLTRISEEKAVIERESGASCPNSRPGDGPRRRLRDADAQRFSFAAEIVKGRSGQVKGDMRGLEVDIERITSADASTIDPETGTRNKFLQSLSRKLELTATNFNAFRTDPQLRQIRSELADRANRTTFPTGRGSATFSCPDPQLQSALFGVVKAIDQLPLLDKPEIATVEGAQAVVEAFRRLTATLQGALVLKLPPSADEIRELQKQAVRSVEPGRTAVRSGAGSGLSEGGLSQRDYIPLAIAVFVDVCLLLVSIGRPMNRLGGLVPKMREAERGPVYQILSRFDDIHRDVKIREKFEVFRHVVFDFHGDYYVAVPLDAPRNRNPEEVANLQLEAHLLANLFASFEKEKIFSRVYNPLLSRKTIQKKLWQQGSKFAASQAFRIYRFRDGAWSDIILGAVMGAARRAKGDRLRRAREAGPQLDVAETQVAAEWDGTTAPQSARSEAAAQGRAEEILAETLGDGDGAPAADEGQEATEAKRMAAMLGPYTDEADDPDMPESLRASRPAKRSWPYRKPPPQPGEAHVELLPANSNTQPHAWHDDEADVEIKPIAPAGDTGQADHAEHGEHGLADGYDDRDAQWAQMAAPRDNVIPMPMPVMTPAAARPAPADMGGPRGYAGQMPVRREMAEEPRAAFTDVLAHALAMPPQPLEETFAPAGEIAPTAMFDEPEAVTVSVADGDEGRDAAAAGEVDHSPDHRWRSSGEAVLEARAEPLEAHMNVRITQRTADFQIPLNATSGGQPIAFLRKGARITFAEPVEFEDDNHQLRLDLAANETRIDAVDNVAAIAAERKENEVSTDGQPSVPVPALGFDTVEETGRELTVGGRREDPMSEEELVEISRRFAPARRAE